MVKTLASEAAHLHAAVNEAAAALDKARQEAEAYRRVAGALAEARRKFDDARAAHDRAFDDRAPAPPLALFPTGGGRSPPSRASPPGLRCWGGPGAGAPPRKRR